VPVAVEPRLSAVDVKHGVIAALQLEAADQAPLCGAVDLQGGTAGGVEEKASRSRWESRRGEQDGQV
jgi:hypothetical protein